jgi:undecaprenyl-diphosphatase
MTYGALNHFDAFLIKPMNWLVGRSALFDKVIIFLADNPLISASLLAVFWAYWFRPAGAAKMLHTREHVLATLWAGFAAIVIARALALELPFRERPRYDPAVHFHVPDQPNPVALMHWNAFPSDHAVMFSALAVGLGFISWRLGLIATLYVACLICFPRAYLGYHYPSDLFVGFIIGASCTFAFNLGPARRCLAAPLLSWERTSPRAFYMVFFLVTFQFATMWDSLRVSAKIGYHFAEQLLARS